MFLFGLLVLIAIATILSMVMTMMHLQAEEKSGLGKYWVILSSVGIVSIMGLVYVMRTETTHKEAAVHQDVQETHAASTETVKADVDEQSTGMPADKTGTEAIQSYDYLFEVLAALKKGDPIPEQYLQLLPETDRAMLQQGFSSEGQMVHGQMVQKTEQAAEYPSKTAAVSVRTQAIPQSTAPEQQIQQQPVVVQPTEVQSEQTTPENAAPDQTNPDAPSATHPVSQPQQARLNGNSPIVHVLHHSRDQVRAYFQSLYAQPLQQTADQDLYLSGNALFEVKYQNGKAASLTFVFESLSPTGKDRAYWEQSFRTAAGMGDQPATSSTASVSTWSHVFAGTDQIQFTFDLANNRGVIQAD